MSDIDTQSLFGHAIVAFATDTVYGLGCVMGDTVGLDTLYQAKQRPADQPMQLLVAHRGMASMYVAWDDDAPLDAASRLYWQRTDAKVDPRLVKQGKIAIRQPALPALVNLIAKIGVPLIASSANKRGKPVVTSLKAVRAAFPHVPVVLQASGLSGQASAIWDMTCTPPQQLR